MQGRALEKGSTWRKWDLHVHTPTTRLNNQYELVVKDVPGVGQTRVPDWGRFCELVEQSDVSVFGITDYFSFDSFFDFKDQFNRLYPESEKVFFPNLELRLDQSVHHSGQEINAHIIFRDDLSREDANRFLNSLQTTKSSPGGRRNRTLYELSNATEDELESVSVRFIDCVEAIKSSFDDIGDENIEDVALIVISGNKDGLSPGNFNKRKGEVIDSIDQRMHAVFSNAKNASYWLNPENRSTNTDRIFRPHPTFYGCDAHDFATLEKCLGTSGRDDERAWDTTWVKAEPSWNGLLQTLVEPGTRVKIQEECPDSKLDYLVIDRLKFDDPQTFPKEIQLNSGLNAIIGSRSSGKSSLLAHVAHSVAPEETVKLQIQAGYTKPGPAAGYSWEETGASCEVVWRDGHAGTGKVIYIPQNFLNALSGMPQEINKRIIPALKKTNQSSLSKFEKFQNETRKSEERIEEIVETWFATSEQIDELREELKSYPSKDSVKDVISQIEKEILEQGLSGDLLQEDIERVKEVSDARVASETLSKKADEFELASTRRERSSNSVDPLPDDSWDVYVTFAPGPLQGLLSQVELDTLQQIQNDARESFRLAVETYLSQLLQNRQFMAAESLQKAETLRKENADVVDRVERSASLLEKQKKIQSQRGIMGKVDSLLSWIEKLEEDLRQTEKKLHGELQAHQQASETFVNDFNQNVQTFEQRIMFSVEVDDSQDTLATLSEFFHQRSNSHFMRDGCLDVGAIREKSASFLSDVRSGTLKTKKVHSPQIAAKEVLSKHFEIRFSALMDGDSIGGFSPSTMTPGKQALFALTLLLSDAGEEWPLLIDQPEDDLDSKSIYEDVVTFLKTQKQRRQIIMVSHNANLVVGSDAELVLVANRHGRDRPNEDEQVFDYRSGGLESSSVLQGSRYELDGKSIREHVIEILDGGEDAFKKRQAKYKL